jgi:hypothetical protein
MWTGRTYCTAIFLDFPATDLAASQETALMRPVRVEEEPLEEILVQNAINVVK